MCMMDGRVVREVLRLHVCNRALGDQCYEPPAHERGISVPGFLPMREPRQLRALEVVVFCRRLHSPLQPIVNPITPPSTASQSIDASRISHFVRYGLSAHRTLDGDSTRTGLAQAPVEECAEMRVPSLSQQLSYLDTLSCILLRSKRLRIDRFSSCLSRAGPASFLCVSFTAYDKSTAKLAFT